MLCKSIFSSIKGFLTNIYFMLNLQRAAFLKQLGIEPGRYCLSMMKTRDTERIAASKYSQSETNKNKRRKTQGKNKENDSDDTYISGGH